MPDARAIEHFPVGLPDAALVADHQGHDDTGILLVRQCGKNAIAQPAAAALDGMRKSGNESVKPPVHLRIRIGPHRAGCAHVLLKQPGFVIEAERIGIAMRAAQAHQQLPAFAGLHMGDRLHVAISKTRIPGQGYPWRHGDRMPFRVQCPFHRKNEAHPLLEGVRQAIDRADHHDILSLQFLWQRSGKIMMRKQGRPEKSGSRATHDEQGNAEQGTPDDARAPSEHQCARSQQAHREKGWQCSLCLQPADSNQKTEDQAAHDGYISCARRGSALRALAEVICASSFAIMPRSSASVSPMRGSCSGLLRTRHCAGCSHAGAISGASVSSTMLSSGASTARRRICKARVKVIAPPKPSRNPRSMKVLACWWLPLNACAMPPGTVMRRRCLRMMSCERRTCSSTGRSKSRAIFNCSL